MVKEKTGKKISKKEDAELTTRARLSSAIKGARDIMRKDKGLSGELDRLPVLTWIMLLKFIDSREDLRKTEAETAGKKFRQIIEPPYRWRDWAAEEDGITGDDLLRFIDGENITLPDGKKGPGLFKYLSSLKGENSSDARNVIARAFSTLDNRMKSGYLLRDVINKINCINFSSSDEIHTLSNFYESMLKEMRDAAGDSGEFYTPRPVIKFMVKMVGPKLGETILDPAAGTGGFLVESFEHLKQQCKTTEDIEFLQNDSIFGGEAKPLPFLLCEMNLYLHGLESPQIDPENSLRFKISEIGDKDRVDIIVTNPPFGGEEEKGIQGNFPSDMQTAETALLFLQLIMRKLRRKSGEKGGGRCAMIVPNGVLFGDGVAARIKEQLLREYNLHTIVRLPNGVFAPYTGIPTNLLFFNREGPTKEVWYYEHPLPEGRKNYTKTQPLQFEEFEPCMKLWKKREENERAWKISAEEIIANNYNLDRKNPRGKVDFEHLPPEQLVDDILEKERRITELMLEIKTILKEKL